MNETKKKVTSKTAKVGRRTKYSSQGKNRDKERSNVSAKGDYEDKRTTDNDPLWYAHTPSLMEAAASLPMSNVLGQKLGYTNSFISKVTANSNMATVPGLFTIFYTPSFGAISLSSQGNATAAVNVSAQNVYSYVRHANSGSVNYDAPDLMMGILAADQVFACIALAMRAYGIAMIYDQKNRYTPGILLNAMGFNPDEVRGNLAQFRYYINLAIARASVIWVPSDFSLVARHFWMNSNVYTDGDDPKSQMYMYVPEGFYQFSGKTDQTGSSLVFSKWTGKSHSPLDWYTYISNLLDPITTDEDLGIMFGDMLKAYGKDRLYALNTMDENYTILPVKNEEVLSQIHNSTAFKFNVANRNIHQDGNGNIYEDPFIASQGELSPAGHATLLDYVQANPTAADIMVSTRMTPVIKGMSIDDTNFAVDISAGSEIPVGYQITLLNDVGTPITRTFETYYKADATSVVTLSTLISKFDWAPKLYMVSAKGSGLSTTFDINAHIGDLQNYTFIDMDVLMRMHDIAIMSELNVPLNL